MGKVLSTLLTVVVAVGVSAGIWIVANLVFNQARHHWVRFNAMCFAAIGFIVGAVLSGNQLTIGSGSGFLTFIWLPLVAAVVFGAVGVVLERTDEPRQRMVIATVAGVAIGVAIGLLIRDAYKPALDAIPLVGWTAAGVAIGAGINLLRGRAPVTGVLTGGAIGFLAGGWGSADLGAGSTFEAIVASAVPCVLLGVRFGLTRNPDLQSRARIDVGSRAVIFIGPALLFIFITLIIPTVRTFYLSFLDQDSESFVRLENYAATFTDRTSWNSANWTNMFTSRLLYIGAGLLFLAVVVGSSAKRRTGRAVEIGNATVAPLVGGLLFVAFAAFAAFRGTIVNNLWWVVTVVFASTAMGLAVAVLADGARGEKVAKSLVFLPLAISLVGASVIWRFMYVPRDATQEQTGTLNALWVGLGRLSNGSGLATILIAVVLVLVLVLLLAALGRALVRREWGRAAAPAIVAVLVGWFLVRYLGSGGVGGAVVNEAGEVIPRPIGFIQESPFNNMWLMVILIWLQTGFAMVILSAAIKAVPDELIEAARVDGATTSQVFWRVTLPQIAPTIGVVVTTLIVLVMKVFDIVKVVTNGNFDTQVLANDMYNEAFQNSDTGRGAALAVILFLSVLPVMVFNIRRMQREA